MNKVKTTTVAKINQVDILVIENGEKRVAIRPICDALGVSIQGQLDKLKDDPILGSTIKLSLTVGADGREREMQTIPYMFVFGWLFRIDSRNVKEEARETVLKYQLECYKALYYHFTSYAEFVEQKQKAIEAQMEIVDDASKSFNTAKDVMGDAKKVLLKLRKLTFEDFDAENRQLNLFSDEDQKGGFDE